MYKVAGYSNLILWGFFGVAVGLFPVPYAARMGLQIDTDSNLVSSILASWMRLGGAMHITMASIFMYAMKPYGLGNSSPTVQSAHFLTAVLRVTAVAWFVTAYMMWTHALPWFTHNKLPTQALQFQVLLRSAMGLMTVAASFDVSHA